MSTAMIGMALEDGFWSALSDPYSKVSTPAWPEPDAYLYEVLRDEICGRGSEPMLVDLLQIVFKAQETDGRAKDFLAALCKGYVQSHIGELIAEEAAEEANERWSEAPCLVI